METQIITKAMRLNRAKCFDEPYVRDRLEKTFGYAAGNRSIEYKLGSVSEDWMHADIVQTNTLTGDDVIIDVKRSSHSCRLTNNFQFTFINRMHKEFNFVNNGFFAYIDDSNGDVALVSHESMKNILLKRYDLFTGDKALTQLEISNIRYNILGVDKHSRYILIPKTVMKKISYYVIKGSNALAKRLAINSDETLFVDA